LLEAFEIGDLGAVVWAEATAQLSDAMIKTDEKSYAWLLATLSDVFCGMHAKLALSR
jgi:hypothetical protein